MTDHSDELDELRRGRAVRHSLSSSTVEPNLMGAIQSIAPNEVSPASFEQVLELATLLGESIRRNLSQPKGKLYEELLVFAEQCSQVEDRHAIGLAIYAFIAAREGNKKA